MTTPVLKLAELAMTWFLIMGAARLTPGTAAIRSANKSYSFIT